ncbi:type VI secretion system tip protein TssI/VgrG [Paraburkholderia mimosarum]|uniref:type VI secretion system tip protein TssI/VgrG n=1 Tax=Paraburkholderia mimosarum TaxID=312026 RepID=UPI0003F4F7D0|nr:type VI secretion system tip protein TssI/VgrG [Paraburkholderia mimosarum]
MVSMADQILANKRFVFSSEAFGADKFAVVEMEGFESISQPFRFVLTLVSDDASIDFDSMLSHPATFEIYGPEGEIRTPRHGILAEFEQLHRADGYVFYRAVLVPRLWRLSLFRLSEVYLGEQSIVDTLRTVLENGRLTSADYEFRLTGTYRPRSFVCQYQETYLDFLSRWMEKEGIYYCFDHSGGTEKIVIVDDKVMIESRALPVSYRPDDSLDTGVAADSVRDFVCRQRPLPHEVVLQGYNYRKAALQLKASATVSDSGIGEVVLHGENFRTQDEGERYAKLRAQEIVCASKVFSGEGAAMGLRAGYFCALSHHYRDDFNGEYLVTEVHHQGSQAGALLSGLASPYSDGARGGEIAYRNGFRAIPAATQFRPERVTAKPRVAGTMNATIDGQRDGQYAELDEFGQYKVQLPFDVTDKNPNKGSARLRMATPYAGTDHGMHFPLHKDAEVLLSFIDGDPDQPVIVGSLPNSENPSVVTQDIAEANRISTAGGNQVYMGDGKGKEAIWLHSPSHNGSVGIGSTDPKGGGGLWMATAGSSERVTVGANNGVTVGPTTAITVGTSVALSAGVDSNYTLGANVGATWGQNVQWAGGRTVSLGDAETVLLKTDARLQGSATLRLSGGMQPAIDTAVQAAKKSVLRAAQISTAVNAALGVAAGATVTAGVYRSGGEKTAGKLDIANPWGYGATAEHMAGAVCSGLNLFRVLRNAGNSIAAAVAAAPTYSSNIDLDISGITAMAGTAVAGGQLKLTPLTGEFSVTNAVGKGSVDVTSANVTVTAADTNKVVVDSQGVAATGAAASIEGTCTASFKAGTSASVTGGTGVGIKADTGAVSIEATTGSVDVKADAGVSVEAVSKVSIAGARLQVVTDKSLTLNAGRFFSATAKFTRIGGGVVRIG